MTQINNSTTGFDFLAKSSSGDTMVLTKQMTTF